MPMPELREVTGLDDADADRRYPVITGEYTGTPRWASRPVRVGAAVAKPTPVFTKLDESVVEEELRRLRGDDEGAGDGAA